MQPVAMIFNGVHFEQSVADKALAHAKQSNSEAIALFLKTAHDKTEGYGFPSDLKSAETITTENDADQDDKKIIESNIHLLQHEATRRQITLHSELLEDPSAEKLNTLLQNAEVIFMQGHDENGKVTPAGIDVYKLLSGIHIPIEIVP